MNFPLESSGMLAVLVAGFFFGYFLEVSGLGSPRKLTAQFTLRDWSVFKVMFTAIVVAAAGLWLFDVIGWLRFDALKIQTTFFWAMAIGGALLGAGMAIGGYCPGTSVVGLFTGRVDALVFMLGMLIGTTLFAANFKALQGIYMAAQGPKGQTLAALTGLPTWLILLSLAGLAFAGFRLGAWFENRDGGAISAGELSE
ncbi:hypothetical protein SKTS_22170 [Sulfurimicrobium lacus]|uniref:Uncharacterized protein n=1 Tax=Sulfurimicrobium lacus TaxID=2715678 RepID=A0A6F8VDU7_9PROT|nr:DUF6691 family protein [Sulfurimicrobium lacus]BCB27331.1 hypothetical protein SKTS_22170 [Sulfurimicrobium lacus]